MKKELKGIDKLHVQLSESGEDCRAKFSAWTRRVSMRTRRASYGFPDFWNMHELGELQGNSMS